MHHVNHEVEQIARKRWEYILANPEVFAEAIDPHLRDFITEFNKHLNVITLWSCQGHTREERGLEPLDPEKRDKFRVRSYVAFVSNEDNIEFLTKFSNWLTSSELITFRKQFHVELKMTRLNLAGISRDHAHEQSYYPVLSLEISYNIYKDPEREKYKELLTSLLTALNKSGD